MKGKLFIKKILYIFFASSLLFLALMHGFSYSHMHNSTSFALESFPFYNLNPQNLVLRSKFYTSYSCSSQERKNNIRLAASSLNKTIVDVDGEFSFNLTVGPRTIERGYATSKIIVGGEFVDGVGGGVCQVSTTLYNAVLLSGLKITEYHPHSLPVSYVAPSFDAMVSFNFADLKFINNTNNPIIISAQTTDSTITIEIYGEPSLYTYSRQSVVIEEIPALPEREIIDFNNQYPDLYQGQRKILSYGKAGLKSEAFLIKLKNGKPVSTEKIRKDVYSPTRGVIVIGTTPFPAPEPSIDNKANEQNLERTLI